MRYLLDTNVAIWLCDRPDRLSPVTLDRLADPANALIVSSISVLEVAIKISIDKLRLAGDFVTTLERQGCEFLPVGVDHAWQVSRLPLLHRDPFDRVIVAQAQLERATLVTSDRALADYEVSVLLV